MTMFHVRPLVRVLMLWFQIHLFLVKKKLCSRHMCLGLPVSELHISVKLWRQTRSHENGILLWVYNGVIIHKLVKPQNWFRFRPYDFNFDLSLGLDHKNFRNFIKNNGEKILLFTYIKELGSATMKGMFCVLINSWYYDESKKILVTIYVIMI